MKKKKIIFDYCKFQFNQIKKGGKIVAVRKFLTLIKILLLFPLCLIFLPILIIIYLISPWFLIRFQWLPASRIGFFTVNTELYCCEQDVGIDDPGKPFLDLFCLKDICNKQLAKMWKRELKILPTWILSPLLYTNSFFCKFISGFKIHEVQYFVNKTDIDVHNLLDKSKPHLKFTAEEEILGEKILKEFGLQYGDKFVCLIVRDNKYLEKYFPSHDWSYHDYRDRNIDNYILAAEELSKRGYFIFRMGKEVSKPLKTSNYKIIDYANSNLKSDFMDIYLGAKCEFCISTATGFDGIPIIFRKPIACTELSFFHARTAWENYLFITKNHISIKDRKKLTLSQIFNKISLSPAAFKENQEKAFKQNGVELKENTPQDIKDLVIEMSERVGGTWKEHASDMKLQKQFWQIFLKSVYEKNFYKKRNGNFKAKFGSTFLKKNLELLN